MEQRSASPYGPYKAREGLYSLLSRRDGGGSKYGRPALDLVAETRCLGLTPTVSDVVFVSGAFVRWSSFDGCTPDAILHGPASACRPIRCDSLSTRPHQPANEKLSCAVI